MLILLDIFNQNFLKLNTNSTGMKYFSKIFPFLQKCEFITIYYRLLLAMEFLELSQYGFSAKINILYIRFNV